MLLKEIILFCRHQQYIGTVKHAVFHSQKSGRKRVIVATEENVVASLNLCRCEICMFISKLDLLPYIIVMFI